MSDDILTAPPVTVDIPTDYNSPFGLLPAQLQENLRLLEGEEAKKRQEALSASSLSGQEALTGSALAALPILIGLAAKGKKGAGIGAQAGGLGSLSFFQTLQKEEDKKRALAEAELKSIQKQQDYLQKQKVQLGIEGGKIKSKEGLERYRQGQMNQRAADYRKQGGTPSFYERLLGPEGATNYLKAQYESIQKDIDNKNALPQKAVDQLAKFEVSIYGYNDLVNLVTGSKINPKDFDSLSTEFQKVINERKALNPDTPGKGDFRAGDTINVFRDVLARTKLDPNSETGLAFRRMLELGRERAVGQNGVATVQDVEEEVFKVLISPLETIETYTSRLQQAALRDKRDIANLLNKQKANKKGAASTFEKLFQEKGLLPSTDSAGSQAQEVSPRVSNVTIRKNGNLIKAYRHADGAIRDELGNLIE